MDAREPSATAAAGGAAGSFHLMLPPGPTTTPDQLARAFLACPRIRRIVYSVVDRRGVRLEFEPIMNDTFMVCLSVFDKIDLPINIYSYIYRTADNLALVAFRQLVDFESDELITAKEEQDARDAVEPDTLAHSPMSELEQRQEVTSVSENRARFREKLAKKPFPKHISRDLEQNLKGTKERRRGASVNRERPPHPLSAELCSIRSQLGLTIFEFAERCSVPKARMWSYLRGLVQSDVVMKSVLETARLLLPAHLQMTRGAENRDS
ncbi:hypothetical protein [Burkholderia anthina]|uniref:hypothetical protein n=1 Tax=Burkholderia anthina TaxID=179879 RepID=UPI00158CFFF0|nr:hypothetical protein [Burkholderia anthina]